MAFRQMTPIQKHAEVFLAAGDNVAVLLVWVGLAIGSVLLAWVGAVIIALRPFAVIARGPAGNLSVEAVVASGVIMIVMQFMVGGAVYAIFNWPEALEVLRTPNLLIDGVYPWQGGVPQSDLVQYGLYGILWAKTLFCMIFGIPGATYQVLEYETGNQSVDQYR